MTGAILVDTCILISLQRGDAVTAKQFKAVTNKILISRVTASELLFGSRNKQEKKINKLFISQFEVLEINKEISELSYKLIDTYSLKHGIGMADALITATALSNKVSLWTHNNKHFKQIEDLKIYTV